MNPAYPQRPDFAIPFGGGPAGSAPTQQFAPSIARDEVPDHHSQLEELLGHVRRCERWARLDDRIDLSWRLGGNA
jgi:hypothetical protein